MQILSSYLGNTLLSVLQGIKDHGPHYHEFHPDAFIKEPWNAYSSLFFLIPATFWLIKLRGKYREYSLITLFLPLLYLNGIGSTVYHAFRASDAALLLDWVPAALLMLILSWYMWKKVLNKPVLSVFVVLSFYVFAGLFVFTLRKYIGNRTINIGYLITGLSIILPSVIFLVKTNYYKWHLLTFSFVLLGIALLFRSLDYPTPNPFPKLLPQGTHFLWHIVSALAVFTLGYYLIYIKDVDVKKNEES